MLFALRLENSVGSQRPDWPSFAVAETEEGDSLRPAGVGYAELVAGQIEDRLPVAIDRHHVEVHHPGLVLSGTLSVESCQG